MTNKIHATAIIEGNVKLGDNIEIGPLCVVSGNVTLGNGVKLISQVHVSGNTKIGDNTKIFPFASITTSQSFFQDFNSIL